MAGLAKRIIKKSRRKLVADVLVSVDEINAKQSLEFESLRKSLKQVQTDLERSQHDMHIDVINKILNSNVLVLSDKEIIAKIFNGLKIYLDPKDMSVTPHLALDTIWEQNITMAWQTVVQPHDVVLDIGANFGYYGAIAAQKTDKNNSKVVFFEANPNLIPYLQKTLSINWLNEQSVIENLAITEKEGEVKLNILKDHIGSSSLQTIEQLDKYMHNKMQLETASTVSVPGTSIDLYCKENKIKQVNLIKMDIEGLEDKAYLGMRETVKASPDITLFVEFTKEGYEDPRRFYEQMLADFGHVYLIDGQGRLVLQKQTDYASVIGNPHDWVMPVFSKNDKLASA